MGTVMPYAKLGYNQMDDFLRSIPDVVSSYTNFQDGMLYVKAVPLEGSSHINELVQGQRSAKKKKTNSNFSMGSRFKSFRVSSQVAPNPNFNRNYNSNFNAYKPPERFDNTRSGTFTRPPLYSSQFKNSNMPPRFVKLYNQAPLSVPVMQKPNFPPSSNYSQRVPTTTGPSMFSNSYNINNNKPLTVANAAMEPKPFAVSLQLNVTPANKPQGVPGRAHLTPQLMQPRTPALQVQPDKPATPPVTIQTSNVQPTPQVIQKPSAFVDSVQNSLNDLKISSSKPVDPINPFEQDSATQMQHLPKPLSPIKVYEEKPVSPDAFQWRPVTPNPFQEATKSTLQFLPSGFEQRKNAPHRRVVIKKEEQRPRLPEIITETFKVTRKLPEMVKEEVPVAPTPTISAAARAPRVLLRNGVPVVVSPPSTMPLQTPRPFMYLPDHLPAEAPKQPPPVSPLLSRRLPHQPVESQPVSRTVTQDFTPKPKAVLSTR